MKQLLALLFLVILAPGANAKWVKISETANSVHYIDTASVKSVADSRTVWELQDLKVDARGSIWQSPSIWQFYADFFRNIKEFLIGRGSKALSFRYMSEYDCGAKRWRVDFFTSHAGHMATGEILDASEDNKGWTEVPPNTPAMSIWKKVCHLRK